MKTVLTLLLIISSCYLSAQSTYIKKTSFTTDAARRYPNDTICGPQMTAITSGNLMATYVKINTDESQLILLDSVGTVIGPIFTSFNSGVQYSLVTDLISTPDDCILYSQVTANPGLLVYNSSLTKLGNIQWTYNFPGGYLGENIYDISITPEGNYACKGIDTLYIISPLGIRIPSLLTTTDQLLFGFSNTDRLIKHAQLLQRIDSLGNILWSIPYAASYIANDTIIYASSNSNLSRIDPVTASILWTIATPGIYSFDFTSSGGCIALDETLSLRIFNSAGQLTRTKTFPFALHGLRTIKRLPTGQYFTGGAYPTNTFMYLWNYLHSSFLATLDSSANGVIDSTTIIWPTDSDQDHFITYADINYLNISFGSSGPPRDVWPAFRYEPPFFHSDFATDWDQSFCNGVNYKFSDANGDGIIDSLDFVSFQYAPLIPGQVHLRSRSESVNSSTASFSLVPDRAIVTAGDTVRFYFVLGDSVNKVDSVSTFAFCANGFYGNFNPDHVLIHLFDNDLGNVSELRLDSTLSYPGYAGFGFCIGRKDKQNRYNVYDTLGYVELRVSDTVTVSGTQRLTIDDISILSNQGCEQAVIPIDGEINIQVIPNSVQNINPLILKLSPNPSDHWLKIETNKYGEKNILLADMMGKVHRKITTPDRSYQLPTNDLPNGVYTLTIQEKEGTIVSKFIVQH
ncbi:MAG TPA: T9SS type A sorting domain-containing protein [Bacteroidia bacterium]|nr:T9SS type A sorting domain-containing protein [Bacteroidia bacterium]